jgi:hypothetical protein
MRGVVHESLARRVVMFHLATALGEGFCDMPESLHDLV